MYNKQQQQQTNKLSSLIILVKITKNVKIRSIVFFFNANWFLIRFVDFFRYLRCSGYRSTGCRGKGYMIRGQGVESFVLVDEHSHPPNFLMERRSEIAKTLKEFAISIPGKPMEVYNSVVSM